MTPQHCHPSYSTHEGSQSRTDKIARHRRYHPYRRNVATLQKTDDDNYRAVYESSIPILGMAKFPVQGVIEFRPLEQAPAREGRVKRVLGAILRFMARLRQKAEDWLVLRPANALPQPRPANADNDI